MPNLHILYETLAHALTVPTRISEPLDKGYGLLSACIPLSLNQVPFVDGFKGSRTTGSRVGGVAVGGQKRQGRAHLDLSRNSLTPTSTKKQIFSAYLRRRRHTSHQPPMPLKRFFLLVERAACGSSLLRVSLIKRAKQADRYPRGITLFVV